MSNQSERDPVHAPAAPTRPCEGSTPAAPNVSTPAPPSQSSEQAMTFPPQAMGNNWANNWAFQNYPWQQQAWGNWIPQGSRYQMPHFYPNTQLYGYNSPAPPPPPSATPPSSPTPPPPPPLLPPSAGVVAPLSSIRAGRAAKNRPIMIAKDESAATDYVAAKEKAAKLLQAMKLEKKKRHKQSKIMLPTPQPTGAYIMEAIEEAFVIDPPCDRMLVILDLNGTLIYRPDSRKHPTRMIARPFLQPFLEFLFENFDVMIWSSAKPENVKVLVNNVLNEDLQSKLTSCWARDTLGLTPNQYYAHVQVYKDLDRVWDCNTFEHRYNQRNTILIDDSSLKASAQPHNLIEIPEFEATEEQMKDDILREVAGYLVTARMQYNVSSFMHSWPFKAGDTWAYDWPDSLAEAAPIGEEASRKTLT